MAYKWKPTASQKKAYMDKMIEKSSLPTFTTPFAIRKGCFVKWYSTNRGAVLKGVVVASTYGSKRNQHTFTVQLANDLILVKGRNLYPNILNHTQGEESKNL